MFDLSLTAEQLEFRDTVRDFIRNEVKSAALHPDRLQPFAKPLLMTALEDASRMGLRTLALSENAGGAGADTLTSCIVLEELAAGDVDLAVVLAHTSLLAHTLFDAHMNAAQRARFLPGFLDDRAYHLALAAHDYDAERGWQYHRPYEDEPATEPAAVKQPNGDWVIDGAYASVPNATLAQLFVVQVRTERGKSGANGLTTLLVPRNTPGLVVAEAPKATGEAIRWQHGAGAGVEFKQCRVPADHLLGKEHQSRFGRDVYSERTTVQLAAINIGVGRAAFDAALDYAQIRVQGGRPIVQHQSIGTILADCATKLENARNLAWKAAWSADHPETVADHTGRALPLHVMARSYTADAMHEVALGAAECFGAMGVMRDMPLQKYVHDTHVLLYAADNDSASRLLVSEALAGYERPAAA